MKNGMLSGELALGRRPQNKFWLTFWLCFAGAVALQILARRGVTVGARIAEIAGVCDGPAEEEARFLSAREKEFPVADDDRGAQMREAIAAAKALHRPV